MNGLPSNGPGTSVGGRILNGSDVAAGATYAYFDFSANGWRFFSLQFTLTAMTIAFEVSNDADDVTDANATWTDVTNALFGAPTFVASGMWIVDTALVVARCRIKYTRSNATNTVQFYLCLGN